ncbi:MAG: permease, partial [bacterium]|nr:permease [bacterium]
MDTMDLCFIILQSIWNTLLAMAPWLLFGFFAAGILSLFFSPEFVSAHLGRKAGKKAVWLSVLLGVPLPLCSCGVLPAAVGLRKSGASKGATAAFLISTPQTGIDSFFATGSLLGWIFALTRPLIATLTGLTGGMVMDAIDNEPIPEAITAQSLGRQKKSFIGKLFSALQYGYGMLLGNVAWALCMGILISALIMGLIA